MRATSGARAHLRLAVRQHVAQALGDALTQLVGAGIVTRREDEEMGLAVQLPLHVGRVARQQKRGGAAREKDKERAAIHGQ